MIQIIHRIDFCHFLTKNISVHISLIEIIRNRSGLNLFSSQVLIGEFCMKALVTLCDHHSDKSYT